MLMATKANASAVIPPENAGASENHRSVEQSGGIPGSDFWAVDVDEVVGTPSEPPFPSMTPMGTKPVFTFTHFCAYTHAAATFRARNPTSHSTLLLVAPFCCGMVFSFGLFD